jgi:hypothetical protein
MAATIKLVTGFSNVVTGQTIPRSFVVSVNYCNGTPNDATLTVSCGGASVTPASRTVPHGTGTVDFTVTHTAPGTGHSLTATLTQNGTRLVGAEIGVNVG